ncbi:MAG: M67 family metallopeptidase [Deltaproteobacteria bacterium]|nr:M67 family metallopeptidase [Deltaproteobacteria bacterium]
MKIPPSILQQIIDQAERGYPNETCAILLGRGEEFLEFRKCANIYDEMHARHPETYPRTAKEAYLIDPQEQQKIFDAAAAQGLEVKGIMHSHTDHDAYFSEEDSLVAAPWGEPMYPGVTYIVVSVRDGKFKEMKEYRWNDQKKSFL